MAVKFIGLLIAAATLTKKTLSEFIFNKMAQFFKSFYVRSLQMFVKTRAFASLMFASGVKHLSRVGSWPYQQALDQSGEAFCLGQTVYLMRNTRKLRT